MADTGIRTRHLWLPNPGDAHTFVLIKVLTALQWSLRRVIGNFRKRKKTKTTELDFFFKKIFSTENKNANLWFANPSFDSKNDNSTKIYNFWSH